MAMLMTCDRCGAPLAIVGPTGRGHRCDAESVRVDPSRFGAGRFVSELGELLTATETPEGAVRAWRPHACAPPTEAPRGRALADALMRPSRPVLRRMRRLERALERASTLARETLEATEAHALDPRLRQRLQALATFTMED